MLPIRLMIFFMTTLSISTRRSQTTPVYNLQPALITANIGTMGRNIRHLPCVSLRTGTQGTCMFAIDCLKANGTHLGTCIDRFYFGSCCHLPQRQTPPPIDSISGLLDNTIDENDPDIKLPPADTSKDPSIIISSSSTDKQSTETSTYPTLSTTQEIFTSHPVKVSSSSSTTSIKDDKPITLPLIQLTTTTEKLITTQYIQTTQKTERTTQMTSTTPKPISLSTTQKVSSTVTRKPPVSTIIPTTTATRRRPTKPSTTTTKKPPEKLTSISENEIIKQKPTTDLPLKLTTFQTINNQSTTTIKYKPKPQKPSLSVNTPKPKPRPTTTPKIPSKYTTPLITTPKIPSRITTKRPPITKPTYVTKPTKITRPTIPSVTTKKPTKPTKTTTTQIPTTITPKLTTFSFVSSPIVTTTKKPIKIPTIPTTSTTKLPILIPVQTIKPIAAQQKNTTSTTTPPSQHENEIVDEEPLSSSEHPPGLVTWTNIITEQLSTSTISTPTSTVAAENASNIIDPTEWTPITTPDGWVLLPSVSPSSTTIHENTTTPQTFTTIPPAQTPPPIASKPNITDNTTSTKPSLPSSTSTPASSPTNPIVFPTISSSSKPPLVFPTESVTTMQSMADNQTMNDTKDEVTTLSSVSNFTSAMPPMMSTITDVAIKPDLNMSNYLEVCGRRMYPQARIVGGANSTFGKWPWQISLRQWRTSTYLHKCGAALLNENWAITAAHCVDSVPPSDLLLRLGEHDLSSDSEPYGYQERRVQIVASHPQFDPRTFEYDLALLRFYEPVTFQPNIIPVCVPNDDEGYVGKTAYVTGWGRLHEDGPLPNVLQEVSVPVINNSVCEQMYRSAGYIEHIPNIFICAGWRRGGFDSCEGDSGGPMVIQRPKDKRFILAGIISWGIGCAEPNQPGVYTRISEFRHWINQILQF